MQFNLDEYFCPTPGTEEEKKIIIFSHRHWIAFLSQIIISSILIIVPIVVIILLDIYYPKFSDGVLKNFLVLFSSAYYLLILTFIFNAWISYYFDIYILTDELIVDITQDGFFHRKVAQLSLLRVQDVSSNIKGFLPTLFAFGDVLVETAGEQSEEFLLKSIPNPQEFSAKVLEMHNQLIDRDGRHQQISEAEGTLAPGPKHEVSATPIVEEEKINKLEEKDQPKASPPRAEGEISKDDLGKGGEVKF